MAKIGRIIVSNGHHEVSHFEQKYDKVKHQDEGKLVGYGVNEVGFGNSMRGEVDISVVPVLTVSSNSTSKKSSDFTDVSTIIMGKEKEQGRSGSD